MPPGAAESRGNQKAALAGVLYDKKTDPTVRQGQTYGMGSARTAGARHTGLRTLQTTQARCVA